jgi:hypothetical protein
MRGDDVHEHRDLYCHAGPAPHARGRRHLRGLRQRPPGTSPACAGTTLADLGRYCRGLRFSFTLSRCACSSVWCDRYEIDRRVRNPLSAYQRWKASGRDVPGPSTYSCVKVDAKSGRGVVADAVGGGEAGGAESPSVRDDTASRRSLRRGLGRPARPGDKVRADLWRAPIGVRAATSDLVGPLVLCPVGPASYARGQPVRTRSSRSPIRRPAPAHSEQLADTPPLHTRSWRRVERRPIPSNVNPVLILNPLGFCQGAPAEHPAGHTGRLKRSSKTLQNHKTPGQHEC